MSRPRPTHYTQCNVCRKNMYINEDGKIEEHDDPFASRQYTYGGSFVKSCLGSNQEPMYEIKPINWRS